MSEVYATPSEAKFEREAKANPALWTILPVARGYALVCVAGEEET